MNRNLTIFGTKTLQERKGVIVTRLADTGFGELALLWLGRVRLKREAITQDVLEPYKRSCDAHSTLLDRLPTATVLHVTA
jgi:hypothetical protein